MESQLMLSLHGHANAFLDALFAPSYYLGASKYVGPFALAAAMLCWMQGRKAWSALWAGGAMALVLAVEGLKRAVARPRPHLWEWVHEPKSYSFPSGHASWSAFLYPLLALFLTRDTPKLRAPALALGIVVTLEVGLGRVYQGAHWPSDVLAGWILGGGVLAAGLALVRAQEEPSDSAQGKRR